MVAADVELMALRQEEKDLNELLQVGSRWGLGVKCELKGEEDSVRRGEV